MNKKLYNFQKLNFNEKNDYFKNRNIPIIDINYENEVNVNSLITIFDKNKFVNNQYNLSHGENLNLNNNLNDLNNIQLKPENRNLINNNHIQENQNYIRDNNRTFKLEGRNMTNNNYNDDNIKDKYDRSYIPDNKKPTNIHNTNYPQKNLNNNNTDNRLYIPNNTNYNIPHILNNNRTHTPDNTNYKRPHTPDNINYKKPHTPNNTNYKRPHTSDNTNYNIPHISNNNYRTHTDDNKKLENNNMEILNNRQNQPVTTPNKYRLSNIKEEIEEEIIEKKNLKIYERELIDGSLLQKKYEDENNKSIGLIREIKNLGIKRNNIWNRDKNKNLKNLDNQVKLKLNENINISECKIENLKKLIKEIKENIQMENTKNHQLKLKLKQKNEYYNNKEKDINNILEKNSIYSNKMDNKLNNQQSNNLNKILKNQWISIYNTKNTHQKKIKLFLNLMKKNNIKLENDIINFKNLYKKFLNKKPNEYYNYTHNKHDTDKIKKIKTKLNLLSIEAYTYKDILKKKKF